MNSRSVVEMSSCVIQWSLAKRNREDESCEKK